MIIIAISIGVYWLKSLSGINISESHSLSEYFPFNYFKGYLVTYPEPGEMIIDESFDSKVSLVKTWSNIWVKEEGKVTLNYDSNGINNSRCLLIRSSSKKGWSYSYRKFIGVQKGDVFNFKGFGWIQGDKVSAKFRIASFDKDKTVIKWDYEKTKILKNNQFEKVTKRFTVADGIAFIRFSITGRGVGDFRFDDINFSQAKNSEKSLNSETH